MLQITILFCYASAALIAGRHWIAAGVGSRPTVARLAVAMAAGGIVLHTLALARFIDMGGNGLHFSIGNTISLIAWQVALIGLITLLQPALRGLGAILFPLAAVAAPAMSRSSSVSMSSQGWALDAHVVLSLLAYATLTVAAGFAVLMALQDRQLRQRHPGGLVRLLPPLETMDRVLFAALGSGFALLSLALFSGFFFVQDLFAQHLAHKAVLSLLAWLVFAILLVGRWRFGWRGRRASNWTLLGFAVLLLAYFGTRIVLELVLGRQWG